MTFTTETDAGKTAGWRQALNPRLWTSPPVLLLIAVNLLPLAGVLFWQWDLFTLMMLYWMETGVIGFYTALHMILVGRWSALFFVPFFTVHFGGFMAGHAAFLWLFFADDTIRNAATFREMARILLIEKGLWVTLAAMFVSHGLFFVVNVLRPWLRSPSPNAFRSLPDNFPQLAENTPQWQRRLASNAPAAQDASKIMMQPYGRIVVMHVTIIVGAMLTTIFGTRTIAFVFLIALKTLVDVATHVRRRATPVTMTTV